MSQRYPMKHFANHQEQEVQDLDWGGQKDSCDRFAQDIPHRFEDNSIERDWRPDED